ncbi:MAG: hypothetical protein WD696_20575 [Bryobacteraceae bacterium]
MASRKKKPSFEVSEGLETLSQTGWVYRSEPGSLASGPSLIPSAAAKGRGPATPVALPSGASGLLDGGASTLAAGMVLMANAMLLGLRLFSMPFTICSGLLKPARR